MRPIEPIRLAVNYSPETKALEQAGLIRFNLYKLPDWPELVAEIAPRYSSYVHFTLAAGQNAPLAPDWTLIDSLLKRTDTAFVNLHLAAPPDLNDPNPGEVELILHKAIVDVKGVVDRYGSQRVILENVPISGEKDRYLLPVVTPTAICQVVDETGCGLLLDLAHARLAARALDMDEREYLLALPVQRMRELHITGIGLHEGVWIDHMEMQADDWELLDWVLERVRLGEWGKPMIAAFEYGGLGAPFRWRSSRTVLAEQVPDLFRRMF
jgi:uncharacterized protein (UPF0276 family)